MMKGLAAVVIEAMQAAETAGCADWLWRNLNDEITAADATTLARLVRGTQLHGARRLHEMQASSELLRSLGVEPLMTDATVENLHRILQEWPVPGASSDAKDLKLPDWWRVL